MICISDIVYKQSASVSKKIYFIQRKHGLIPRTFYFLFLSSRQVQTKCSFSENVIRDEQKMNPIK